MCALCGRIYVHKKGYIVHSEICGVPLEERRRYECEECGKSYRCSQVGSNMTYAHTPIRVIQII